MVDGRAQGTVWRRRHDVLCGATHQWRSNCWWHALSFHNLRSGVRAFVGSWVCGCDSTRVCVRAGPTKDNGGVQEDDVRCHKGDQHLFAACDWCSSVVCVGLCLGSIGEPTATIRAKILSIVILGE